MGSANVSSQEIARQIQIMAQCCDQISQTRKQIQSQYQQLGTSWNDQKYRMLGDTVRESNQALRSIEMTLLQGQKQLAELYRIVEEYEQTNITSGSGGTAGGSTGGGGIAGLLGRIFHRESGQPAEEGRDFSGFRAIPNPYGNGSWNVAGNGVEAYLDYVNNPDNYQSEYFDRSQATVEMVDPNLVEGISLGEGDMEDPQRFWSQHESGGTMESFMEIAANIPRVQAMLDEGATVSELINGDDPDLSTCAALYFDTNRANAPTLVAGDGFYIFNGNGRHRILAARAMGYSFPISITGRITRRN